MIQIQRTGDLSYLAKNEGHKPLLINFQNAPKELIEGKGQEFFYAMAQKIATELFENKDIKPGKSRFTDCWTVEVLEKEKSSLFSYFTNALHPRGDDGILRVNVTCHQAPKETSSVTSAKINLPCTQAGDSPFQSPFTKLSALAFQRYENSYDAKDGVSPENTRHCLRLIGGELQLVALHSTIEKNCPINKHTVEHYRNFIISYCGSDKFDYICHRFGLDLSKMIEEGTPLTPEHVYRINIGLNNIESDDLQELLTRLNELDFSGADEQQELAAWLHNIPPTQLNGAQKQGLLHAIQKKQTSSDVKVADFQAWLTSFKGYTELSQLDTKQIAELMDVFSLSKEDNALKFTGKEIYPSIHSAYTTAESKTFKPWVDEQELLHAYEEIQEISAKHYAEILSHIVCKKHLFRVHPRLGYKVGALIPAPLQKNGTRNWYEVVQATYNGYGNLEYILKPLGNDNQLPLIKLYRSTSSDTYARLGVKTVRSDINPINLPGYEGLYRTANHEKIWTQAHSMPLWLGYVHAAQQQIQQKDWKGAYASLKKANTELAYSHAAKNKPLTLKDIIRKHDGIINTLYIEEGIDSGLHAELIKRAHPPTQQLLDPEQKQKNALEEVAIIETFRAQLGGLWQPKISSYSEPMQAQWKEELRLLEQDLETHILSNKGKKEKQKNDAEFRTNLFAPLIDLESITSTALKNNEMDTAIPFLEIWTDALTEHAVNEGENPILKKKNIASIGHSLGGGVAQIHFLKPLAHERRIPLPGSEWQLTAFDAPGIERADNEIFKQILVDHADMFTKLGIHIKIYHQHEKSDPVPVVGTHLGSTSSVNEAAYLALQKNYQYEAVILARNPDAKNKTIAESKSVHATRFLGGIENQDYDQHISDSFEISLFKDPSQVRGEYGKAYAKEQSSKIRKEVWAPALYPETSKWLRENLLIYDLAAYFNGALWTQNEPEIQPYFDSFGNFAVCPQA